MTKRHTELTRQDLKILMSQRNTDTPDGGGAMTKNELTGAANELFPPVSSTAKVMGDLDTRLVYAGVVRDDDAVLHGANMIISEPPEAENVSILAIPADYYGQERASAMERIEGYAVPATESRMTLLGLQRKGSRMVQAYQRENAALPVVGQRFALRSSVNSRFVYEFFRVESFTHELRTFEDDKGEFVRRVIKMVTQTALERDFVGLEEASRYGSKPEARLLETQIADSAKYYGIRPLAKAANKGDSSLQVSSLFEKLVPTSTVETALTDDWAQGREMWIETAPRTVLLNSYRFMPSGSLFLPCPVLPGSVQLDDFTDDAQGTLKKGDVQLSIDYARGVISGFVKQGVYLVSAIPAVQVRNYAYSDSITVDDTNVSTEWAPLLRPAPARGSVTVAFMANRERYELHDLGDYVLRDGQGVARGSVTASGSLSISLPVQPDAGSKIVLSWVPKDFYHAFDGKAAGSVIAPQTLNTTLVLPQSPLGNLKPNTLQLTWRGGSARDDGQGGLTGDLQGKVDYAGGQIYPQTVTTAEMQLSAQQYSANSSESSVKVAVSNTELSLIAPTTVQPGSLKLKLWVQRQTDTGYRVADNRLLWNSTSSR